MREVGQITNLDVADALDALFQIDKGFIVSERAVGLKEKSDFVLVQAGREIVRDVCGGKLELVDPKYWATKEELEIAQAIVNKYVHDGWIEKRSFESYGLMDHDIRIIERVLKTDLPDLNKHSRKRLVTAAAQQMKDNFANK